MVLFSFVFRHILHHLVLWLIHTGRDRDWNQYMEQHWHKRKQRDLVHVPVSERCEHFCIILEPIDAGPIPGPDPVQCEYSIIGNRQYGHHNKKN